MKKLTQKQENFCRLVVEVGNQSEAYINPQYHHSKAPDRPKSHSSSCHGLQVPQCSAAISAVMSKAKLCGLDKQVVEHTGGMNITSITRTVIDPKLVAVS
jgi:hypothetical protein